MQKYHLIRTSATAVIGVFALIIPTLANAHALAVPQQYATIQAAVNAASPGDTVQVSVKPSGKPYCESVTINTSNLTLNAQNGVILNGGGAAGSGDGIVINANNVTVQGFTIENYLKDQTNLAENPRAGIDIVNALYPTIMHVISTCNDQGVYNEGSFDLILQNSSLTNNLQEGFRFVNGITPTIANNTITGNANGAGYFYGVAILGVNGMKFANNIVSNNANGMSIETSSQGPNPPGIAPALAASVNNNVVNDNPGESITIDGAYLVSVSNNQLNGNLFGILFDDNALNCCASNNQVSGTTLAILGNAAILVTSGATGIVVCNNIVQNNLSDGIDVLDAVGNNIHNNTSTNNTSAGSVDASDNTIGQGLGVNIWANNRFGVTSPAGLD